MATATERWKERLITQASGQWRGTMGWDVVGFVDELDAYSAIPYSINDPHPLEPALMLARFRPSSKGLTMITIVAEFEVPVDGYFEGNASPLDQLERYEWKSGGNNLPVDHDINNNPLVTSAGVPIKGATNFFTSRFLHVRRYEPFYNASLAAQYENTVNSAPMTIAGFGSITQGQLILRSYQPTHDYTSSSLWVHVEYVFEFFPTGFQSRNLDADKMCLDSSGKCQQILDASGNPVSKDVTLNGYGIPAQAGFWAGRVGNAPTAGPTPPGATVQGSGAATFLVYNIKGQNDFTQLGL